MSADQPLLVSNTRIFNAQTLATTATSGTLEASMFRSFAIQVIGAGSSVAGSVQLQGSMDKSNWANIGSAVNIASTAISITNYPTYSVPYLQVVFTAASGTGTLDVYIAGYL